MRLEEKTFPCKSFYRKTPQREVHEWSEDLLSMHFHVCIRSIYIYQVVNCKRNLWSMDATLKQKI